MLQLKGFPKTSENVLWVSLANALGKSWKNFGQKSVFSHFDKTILILRKYRWEDLTMTSHLSPHSSALHSSYIGKIMRTVWEKFVLFPTFSHFPQCMFTENYHICAKNVKYTFITPYAQRRIIGEALKYLFLDKRFLRYSPKRIF